MAKINPKDIYKYYSSDEFKPILPRQSRFRHFRFKQSTGSWRKVYDKVYDEDCLKKWAIKLGGCDLYYSVSQWMNPQKISAKGGSGTYHIADNLLLDTDLVFDIDAKEPITMNSLDLARKSTSNIYEVMKDYSDRFKLDYMAFTGYKGFRLAYIDKKLRLPEDPRKRLDFMENNRKLFIEELLMKLKDTSSRKQTFNILPFFDKKVTLNIMCVVRLLGSVHSSTGYISTKLPVSLLKRQIEEILKHVPYIGKKRPVIPKREMIKGDDELSPRPRLLQLADDVSGLASLPYNPDHTYFITNRVLGIKRCFIPIFVYQENQKNFKKEVIELQKEYKLGPLYVFEYGNKNVVISLKSMQKRQLQKILNKSTSKTKYDFMRKGRIFAPFLMKFIQKIPSKFTGHLSRCHFKFVEPNTNLTSNNFCGWDKLELVRANINPTYEKNGKQNEV